ncbi:HAAS signaling domain-containing protein [Modestobacter altitudinis]|uniref:HAAS signaling domain-containing protein n=1 Tax=Modestobacter altitudinis TaxID=2213158 RepID=UPI00110D243C|nr:hypothetical protein [Modestobacter altitudinis]
MGTLLNSTDQAWCDDLLLRLRLLQVPGARIGEVLAEVQSHVAETGEPPREAFGTPREYADQVAQALGVTPVRGWAALRQGLRWRDLLLAVLIGVAGFSLADGLWSLGAGAATTAGLPTWLVCLGAALVLGACTARLVVSARHDPDADPVIDPRNGVDMVPFGRRQVVLLAALPVLALIGMAVGGLLSR